MDQTSGHSERERQKLQRLQLNVIAVCTVLMAAATAAIYWQTHRFEYVTFDDGVYVYDNPHVNQGLSASAIIWALSATYINWHPLTWLSLMLDVQAFGLNAGREHLVNAGIHIASSILLFLTMVKATNRIARSAFLAWLFAVHPLHVESVAWIAERKDVLSAFFELATLYFYVRYSERPGGWRYTTVAVAFACSLLAKPMAVTLPLVLLLLDYWPIKRLNFPLSRPALTRQVREKALFFAMSLGTGVLTVIAQKSSGAIIPLGRISMGERVANAIGAFVQYLQWTFWPSRLAVFYPLEHKAWHTVVLSATFLLLITAVTVHKSASCRYLVVGWLWYLITLLPVIGIVQVGLQSMADRYMYVPMIGISIAVVWWFADLAAANYKAQAALLLSGMLAILILAVAAHRQVSYWSNSEALYNRALAVTHDNYLSENNLGAVMATQGRHEEAMMHFRNAVNIAPKYDGARANLGAELLDRGRMDEAFVQLTESLRLNPAQPVAEANLGAIYKMRGDFVRARKLLEDSLRGKPDNEFAHSDLCAVFAASSETTQALAHCREAIRLNPGMSEAWFNFAQALQRAGDYSQAITALETLLRIDPRFRGATQQLQLLQRSSHSGPVGVP